MKLAEALNERKRLKEKISQLQARTKGSAVHNDGENPLEGFGELKEALVSTLLDLTRLIQKINKTNATATITAGDTTMTLADAIVLRDQTKWQQNIMQSVVGGVRQAFEDRYGNREMKKIAVLDVKAEESFIDELGKSYRLLDNAIQSANWNTDLIE